MSDHDSSGWRDRRNAAASVRRGILNARDVVWIGRFFALAAIGFIGWEWAAKASKVAALQQSLDTRYAARRDRLDSEAADEEKKVQIELHQMNTEHARRMKDAAVLDGSMARAAHAAEWQRRQAHDPRMARSATERSLLQMEQLGADPQLSAQSALERVAALATPPGSRIEVTKVGNLFAVKVAFRMAALTAGESGSATKHTTKAGMRAEIRQISAQVTRDLFAYCGSRGISSISLTCNHTTMSWLLPHGATEEEKEILRSRATKTQSKLYRVVLDGASARNISNWHRASDEEILKLLRLDFDGIDSIEISQEANVDTTEAAEPLIF